MSLFIEKTKKIKGKNTISEMKYLIINGSRQFLLIRSEDINNPIVLFIHGGPGSSEAVFFNHYNGKLESNYTLVNWDQRQSGKSYSFIKKEKSLSIKQYVNDLIFLAEYLTKTYNQEKINIIAHSWGSLIGLLAIKRRPDLFEKYIGVGQVSNMIESENNSYDYVMSEAKKNKNQKAVRELEKIGRPVNGVYKNGYKGTKIQRKWLRHYKGAFHKEKLMKELTQIAIKSMEYNFVSNIKMIFSTNDEARNKMLINEFLCYNLENKITIYETPIYFFLGKYDNQISSENAKRYFDKIKAPVKKLIWFEKSGHAPCFEESKIFNQKVIEVLESGPTTALT